MESVENVNGSDFNDVLTGDEGDNHLDGGYVHQGGPSDTWVGGYGHDTLTGGDGNDLLIGGVENDSLDGGAGTDRAVFQCDYWWKNGNKNTLNVNLSLQVAEGDGSDLVTGVEDLVRRRETFAV